MAESDVIVIDGCLMRIGDESRFTSAEADALLDAFIEWIEARGLGFGGGFGLGDEGHAAPSESEAP